MSPHRSENETIPQGSGFMLPQPAALDCEGEAGAVFRRAAACSEKWRIEFFNVESDRLDGLDRAGNFHELARGLLGISKGSGVGVFHRLACCDGNRSPRSHMAYFRAVQSR